MSSVSGSKYLFLSFRCCTMILILVGLGNISSGISVGISSNSLSWYNGCYIFLGIVLVLLAIFGYTTRSALGPLTFYLILLISAFSAETGFTIGIILYTDYEKILTEAYTEVIRYLMIAACALILFTIVIGFCYRNSLKDALFYKSNENLIHPQTQNEPSARPSVRREEMEKKYNLTKKNTEGI